MSLTLNQLNNQGVEGFDTFTDFLKYLYLGPKEQIYSLRKQTDDKFRNLESKMNENLQQTEEDILEKMKYKFEKMLKEQGADLESRLTAMSEKLLGEVNAAVEERERLLKQIDELNDIIKKLQG